MLPRAASARRVAAWEPEGRKGAQALKRFAIKSGCTIEKGAEHLRVLKGGKLITTIPHSIHGTGTARDIIKKIRTARGCARVGGLVGIAAGEVVFLTVEWGYWEYQAKKGEDASNEWNQMIAEIMAHGRQQGANARAGLCMTCCGEPFSADHCDHAFDSAIAMGFKMLAIANSTSACSTFDQISQRAFQEFVECTEKACEDTGCDPCDGSG